MSGNTAHLSLLTRGVGELKKNGSERIDVFLEPEDYYNYAEHPQKIFTLPPLMPKYNTFVESSRSNPPTNREMHEMYLPKTFMTRKGAMLLFSEDYANKTKSTEFRPHMFGQETEDDSSLHTVTDLTRSILAYGSRKESEVNLKFVHERDTPRKIRPGFSAKRYLSRLTRSFDDSFLDNLLSKGFVNEKTLFHNNALLPHLRRRINDDLSALPPPYRILQHMLKAPGALSGYTFYTQLGGDGGLSIVIEESVPSEKKSPVIEIIDTKDGVAKSVSYSEMSKEDKGHVLADLLVKSAINQALETQKGAMETTLSRVDERDGSEQEAPAVSLIESSSTKSAAQGDGQWGLNMQDAVKSYIESQAASQRSDADSDYSETTPRTFMRGGKAQIHSTKAFEANQFETLPGIETNKGDKIQRESAPKGRRLLPPPTSREYVGGVPVASIRSTDSASSRSSSHHAGSIASSYQQSSVPDFAAFEKPPLSPIIDVSLSREASRTFHSMPPVPPIGKTRPAAPAVQTLGGGLGVPSLNIQPPTPQTSNLTGTGVIPPAVPPIPIPPTTTPGDSADEAETALSPSGAVSDRSSELQRIKDERRKKKRRGEGRGPVASGGMAMHSSTESLIQGNLPASKPESVRSYGSMTGRSLKHSKASSLSGSRKSLLENDSIKGSVIAAPDGEVVKLGDSYQVEEMQKAVETERQGAENVQQSTEIIASISQANKIEIPTGGDVDEDEDEAEEEWPGQTTVPESAQGFSSRAPSVASRAPSVTSRLSGYANTKIRETPTEEAKVEPEILDTQSDAPSQPKSRTGSRATTEQDIIDALSEHAYKIAEEVLSRPHTGEDLAQDAQAAVEQFIGRDAQSAEPSVAEYQDLLKDTLATVVSKVSGEVEEDLREAEVSPELVQALANQEIGAEDIEIAKDEETGKTVIRAKSSASQHSKQTGSVLSRRSSQRSPVVDVQAGEISERKTDKTPRDSPGGFQQMPEPHTVKQPTSHSIQPSPAVAQTPREVSVVASTQPSRQPTTVTQKEPSMVGAKEHSILTQQSTLVSDRLSVGEGSKAQSKESIQLVRGATEETSKESIKPDKERSKEFSKESIKLSRETTKEPSKESTMLAREATKDSTRESFKLTKELTKQSSKESVRLTRETTKESTKLTKEPIREPTKEPTMLSREITKEPSRESTRLIGKPASKEPTQESLKKTSPVVKEQTKVLSRESTKEPVSEPAKLPSREPTKESIRETAKESKIAKEQSKVGKEQSKVAKESTKVTKEPTQDSTKETIRQTAKEKSKVPTRETTKMSKKGPSRAPSIIPTKAPTQEPIETEPTAASINAEDVREDQQEEPSQPVAEEDTDVQGHRKKKPSVSELSEKGKKSPPPKDGKDLGMDVINYGEADKPEEEKKEALVRVPPATERRSSTMKSKTSLKEGTGIPDGEFRDKLEGMIEDTASVKSGKSGKSSVKSKGKKEDDREEFIVGKPKDSTEVASIYAPVEEPPKPVEKKPRVPPAKQTPKSKKKKGGKKAKKEEKAAEEPAAEPEVPAPKEPTPPPPEPEVVEEPPKEATPEPAITPSPEPEEEKDIEFVIVREEFSDEEPEPERKSVRSFRSFRSLESKESKDTETSVEDAADGSEEARARQISNREARAAKRAAQAAKRREEVEKKRREREEAAKREREEVERQEQLARELEEERRRREEERKMSRVKDEEEKRRREEEERRREAKQREEKEREKRLKEDYQRKMEEMQQKKLEEELKRKELEEQRRKEEEEKRIAEEEMMAKMAEEERIAYEKKKAEEEEERKRKEEEERLRREEEARIAMEEARRLAEEMARKQAEYERRLQFNRSLQLESTGLEHTQEVTRAFVFSYYELLQWLGLDVPEFEKWKASLKF